MDNHLQIQRNKGEEGLFMDLVGVVVNKESPGGNYKFKVK